MDSGGGGPQPVEESRDDGIGLRSIYCIYVAPDEDMILEHARCGGFPADRVSQVFAMIDPSSGE